MRDYRRADRIRAAICVTLHDADHALTVGELVTALRRWGLDLGPNANKIVSDATRTPVIRGQIRRAGRGRYAAGRVPPSTLYYMRVRVNRYVADPTRSYSRPDNYASLPVTPD